MTIIMMVKVLCLYVVVLETPSTLAAMLGNQEKSLQSMIIWAAFTTAFIVMQWMI